MLSVTPSAGLPGQPEHSISRRASASFSSSSSSTSSSGEHADEDDELVRHLADVARLKLFPLTVEAADDAEAQKDPGCLRKVCATGTRKSLQAVVRSRPFVLTVAFIITANAVYMGIEVDANPGVVQDGQRVDQSGWAAVEILFSVIFTIELMLRLIATIPAKKFFYSGWNLFDLLIVAVSIVDNIVTIILRNATELGSFSYLRLLRLIRVIRVFRLLRVLGGLWKLVRGILNAAWTLVWTWVLLAIVIYIFSIVSTRLIGQAADPGNGEINKWFGSVMKTQPWSAGFFILYLHVTTFAILNVMIAVIADQSKLKSAEKRLEDLRKAYEKIYKVFLDGDCDQDGVLTKDEFLQQIEQPKVSKYFEEIGIDPNEAEYLFTILDYDGSGCLDASEFVGGLLKVIGTAKAKDIMAVHCELRRSEKEGHRQIAMLEQSIDRRMELVETGVDTLRDEVHALALAIGVSLETRPA
eukprot:g11978.t1